MSATHPPVAPDPALTRLRGLLRLQIHAAHSRSWGTLSALATEVCAELARGRPAAARRAAAAEVAHLQLRLERAIEADARAMARTAGLVAAAAAYGRHGSLPARPEGRRA